MSYQEHVEVKNGKQGKSEIMLYGLSTCMWCEKAVELLEELGVSYSHVFIDLLDVEDQEEVYKELAKFNPDQSFPTIVLDSKETIIGYDEEALRALI